MEDVEKRRARCREYGRQNRKRLSEYRKNRYHTDAEFRQKCKEASMRWRNKKRKEEE